MIIFLRLIGKRVVDFLIVLIELFSLGITAEALRAIIGSKLATLLQRGLVEPKFRIEGVVSTNHFFLRKLDKGSFVLYKNLNISFFRFVTMDAFDKQTYRQTDGRTDGRNSHCKTTSAFHAAR